MCIYKKLLYPRLRFIALLVTCFFSPVIYSGDWLSFETFLQKYHENKANQQTLIQLLKNPDPYQVEFGIRVSAQRAKQVNAVPVYTAIWHDQRHMFPELDFKYLQQPIIRLAIAGALSKLQKLCTDEYRDYVEAQLSSNKDNLEFAIIALGNVGNTKDFERLIHYAELENGQYLFPSSITMLIIDYELGKKEVAKLRNAYDKNSGEYESLTKLIEDFKPTQVNEQNECNKKK